MGSDTVHIRAVREEDARAIQAIYAPIVSETAISFEDEPPSVDEMANRIATITRSYPYLVAEQAGRVTGYAYASPHRSRAAYRTSVDVSAYVEAGSRGNGIGRTLYLNLIKKLQDSKYHAAFAGIALPNAASVGLHESVGFHQIGVYREVGFKFGKWHDVGWWQRLIGDAD